MFEAFFETLAGLSGSAHLIIAGMRAIFERNWRRVATHYDRCATAFFSAAALAATAIFWL